MLTHNKIAMIVAILLNNTCDKRRESKEEIL